MSIETSFDNISKEILKPCKIVEKIKNPPKIAIATFNQKTIDLLLENYEAKIIAEISEGEIIPLYQIEYKGIPIGIFRTLIGSAATSVMLEEVNAMGINSFLYYGSCGTLTKEIDSHGIILPTEAYRDDGVSYHYLKASDFITIDTYDELEKIFNNLKIPHFSGKTWTTDAIYRETENNMNDRKLKGCICVEMECAAIMAVAQFRKIKAYQFIYASDNLDATEWERRVLGKTTKDKRLSLLNLTLEVAKNILENK